MIAWVMVMCIGHSGNLFCKPVGFYDSQTACSTALKEGKVVQSVSPKSDYLTTVTSIHCTMEKK